MTLHLPPARRRSREAAAALGVAVCVAGGCGVERTIAVERIDNPTDAGGAGSDASIDVPADAPDGADGSSSAEGDADAGGSSCEASAFVTASPLGIWTDAGADYLVYNNVYNTKDNAGPQTLTACSYHSWYVVSDQTSDAGVVESYPNVQMNFNDLPVSSLHTVMSSFAETGPQVGIYEYAYDVWLNGVASAGSTQVLVWVDNHGRVPDGSLVTTATLSARTYDVWKTDDSHIVLVATVKLTSGTVNLLEIIQWTIDQGWVDSSSTLGQIDFGVEIESTGGASATYRVDDFSITAM
jgi:hypothetical protein